MLRQPHDHRPQSREGVRQEIVEVHRPEQGRRQGQFGPAEGVERAAPTAPAPDRPRARGDAGDERHQHDRKRVRRGTEGERQQPGPHDLVEHGYESRNPRRPDRQPPVRGRIHLLAVGVGDAGVPRRGYGGRCPRRLRDRRHRPRPFRIRFELGVDEEGDRPHQRVQGRPAEHGRIEAHGGDPPEVGAQDAEHGTGAVDEVEAGDAGPEFPEGPREEPGQHRQGAAHEGGGDEDGGAAEEKLEQEEPRAPRGPTLGEGDVGSPTDLEIGGKSHRVHGDSDLQPGVERQGAGDPVGESAEPGVAERQPPHEGHQDGHDRVARVAEKKGQVAGPGHLVDQAGDPGEQEADDRGGMEPPHGELHVRTSIRTRQNPAQRPTRSPIPASRAGPARSPSRGDAEAAEPPRAASPLRDLRVPA
jgi:hypothetical protein